MPNEYDEVFEKSACWAGAFRGFISASSLPQYWHLQDFITTFIYGPC